MKAIASALLCIAIVAASSAIAQTGAVQATPNPCQIPQGSSSCETDISWQTTGVAQPGLFFGATLVGYGTSGHYYPNWITVQGYTFDVRSQYDDPNSTVLASIFVNGTLPTQPSGSTSATPNPCQIVAGQTSCTVNITWQTNNASAPGLFFGSTLVGFGTSGTYSPAWINTGGFTFDLRARYDDPTSTVLSSVFAYALPPPAQPVGTVTASPNPCVIPSGSSTCSSTVTWQTSNAPLAGLFRSGVLVSASASGSYVDGSIGTAAIAYTVRADRSNPASTVLATTSVSGQPAPAVTSLDLRSYFPAVTNSYLLDSGYPQIQYRFYAASSAFWNVYNTYFDLGKSGGQLLIWEKIANAPASPGTFNCTLTYGHLYLGGGADQSVVEVGDWINGGARINSDGTCPSNFWALGYQNTQTFARPATGLNWSGSNGLKVSQDSFQQGWIFGNINSDPTQAYVSSGKQEYSSPVLKEFLSSWRPDWGRSATGAWGTPVNSYSNVVRMIFYHGVSGSNTCTTDPTNPWSAYYQHVNGFDTYALELYADQLHGILQITVLYDEGGAVGGCGGGPATVPSASVSAVLRGARSYIDN